MAARLVPKGAGSGTAKPFQSEQTKLSEVVQNIYNQKWSSVNKFILYLTLPELLRGEDELKVLNDGKIFNGALLSFTLPDTVTAPIEAYIGGEWKYTTGTKEMKKVDMTLRDFDNFYLHRSFSDILETVKDWYPDDAKWTLQISVDGQAVYRTDKAILNAVGNVSFNRSTSSQIAEFNVSFSTD